MSLSQEGFARYEDVEAIFAAESPDSDVADPLAVGEAFDLVEEEFGRFLDESLHPRGRDSLDDLLAGTNMPRGGVGVDVGCGSGRDVVALATRFGLYVHGVDPAPDNVEKARQRAATAGLHDRTDLQVGRAEAIPLPDASVDVLWCKEAITFTDLDAAMREFHRVMRPGAVGLIYQVLTGPAMSATEAEWLTAQEMGFGTARIVRPDDVEGAIETAGLELVERDDYASEWGEARGSAKSLHAVKMSSMGRVESLPWWRSAWAMPWWPVRRSRLMAVLRRVAMTWGASPVRSW